MIQAVRVFSSIFLGALGLAWLGCGGQVEPGGDGGAPSGSSSGSASGAGSSGASSGSQTVGACPSDPPAAGSKCIAPGNQACAYVTTGQGCSAFVCNASSVWEASPAGC